MHPGDSFGGLSGGAVEGAGEGRGVEGAGGGEGDEGGGGVGAVLGFEGSLFGAHGVGGGGGGHCGKMGGEGRGLGLLCRRGRMVARRGLGRALC